MFIFDGTAEDNAKERNNMSEDSKDPTQDKNVL